MVAFSETQRYPNWVAGSEQGSSAAASKKNGTAVTLLKQKWHELRRALDGVGYAEGHNILFSCIQRRKRLKPANVHQPSTTPSGLLFTDQEQQSFTIV